MLAIFVLLGILAGGGNGKSVGVKAPDEAHRFKRQSGGTNVYLFNVTGRAEVLNYGNNQDIYINICTYTSLITFSLIFFDVEGSNYDWLLINGTRYSGNIQPPSYFQLPTEPNGCVQLHFHSDYSETQTGFSFNYQGYSSISTSTTASTNAASHACGNTARSPGGGQLTLPWSCDGGTKYCNSMSCRYSLCVSTIYSSVVVNFNYLDTEFGSESCPFDYVQIDSIRRCGTNTAEQVVPLGPGGCVTAIFVSDSSVIGSGFSLVYQGSYRTDYTYTLSNGNNATSNASTPFYPNSTTPYYNYSTTSYTGNTTRNPSNYSTPSYNTSSTGSSYNYSTPYYNVSTTRNPNNYSTPYYNVSTTRNPNNYSTPYYNISTTRNPTNYSIPYYNVSTTRNPNNYSTPYYNVSTTRNPNNYSTPYYNVTTTSSAYNYSTTSYNGSTPYYNSTTIAQYGGNPNDLCGPSYYFSGTANVNMPYTGSQYANNMNCSYTLCPGTPFIIIDVIQISIENAQNCIYDALTINGQAFCGLTLPPRQVLYTGGSCITVTFRSDNFVTGTGFQLIYSGSNSSSP